MNNPKMPALDLPDDEGSLLISEIMSPSSSLSDASPLPRNPPLVSEDVNAARMPLANDFFAYSTG